MAAAGSTTGARGTAVLPGAPRPSRRAEGTGRAGRRQGGAAVSSGPRLRVRPPPQRLRGGLRRGGRVGSLLPEAKRAATVVLPKGRGARPISGRSRQPARRRVCVSSWEPSLPHHSTVWGLLAEEFVSCNAPGEGSSPCFRRRGPSDHVLHLSGVPQGCWKVWSSAVSSARRPPQGGWTVCSWWSLCLYFCLSSSPLLAAFTICCCSPTGMFYASFGPCSPNSEWQQDYCCD